jgi:hypothetical protein
MRGINAKFISDLKQGELGCVLHKVKTDDTLCLEIRENYINIYYRGGNMFRIKQTGASYKIQFDLNYCKHKTEPSVYYNQLINNSTAEQWVLSIPYIKAEMDLWFHEHPKSEREYQQLILRDNNSSTVAGDTDYFIADIEYANSDNGSRFDILAVKWVSTATERKNPNRVTLAVMELKYGDGAIGGSAGITKHFDDMETFFSDAQKVSDLYNEVEVMFNQKLELGLINGISKPIKLDRNEKADFVLLFANHKSSKTPLHRELNKALQAHRRLLDLVSIRVASANCLGYGLYENNMIEINEYIKV